MSNNQQTTLSVSQRIHRALQEARTKLAEQAYARREPIAIIGIGCRFPGGADNPEKYWQLLHDGVDAVGPIPDERWSASRYYDPTPATAGKMYAIRGGFIDKPDRFDAEFFGISPREAMSIDPQHRLLLEVAWEALEHAAIAPDSLRHSRAGVFVGICQNDYARMELNSGDLTTINAYSGTGTLLSFAAGRLAYVLGLQGPTMAIDTACSSSLVAVHLACNALRNKEAEVALAGGVHLMLRPEMSVFLSMSRALAADGRSKTFDADADGFTRGEGCGIVILKRLSDAVVAGDRILALLRGSAVNHDGPSSGLTVPSQQAQAQVIQQALNSAKVEPGDIDYIEAHGTGTALGDPIELEALGAALCRNRPVQNPLLIGSVKTNVGHLEGAAGIAGLIKVVLAMQHGTLPPHLHYKTPNPRIDWKALPISVPTQARAWPAEKKRLAGVSSFGMSGVNAHLVVEGFTDQSESSTRDGTPATASRLSQFLALSAKSEAALAAQVENFADHLLSHPDLEFADVCYTANTGRAQLPYRLGIIASSTADLCQKLQDYRNGHIVRGVFASHDDGRSVVMDDFKPDASDLNLQALGNAYASGKRIDWRPFYEHGTHRKVTLPTYPFQRRRYWVANDRQTTRQPTESLAPLIDKMIKSPLVNGTLFETLLSTDRFHFLADHRVYGEVVVPAACHVSLMINAIESACQARQFCLADIVFTQPLVLSDGETFTCQLLLSSENGVGDEGTAASLRLVTVQEGQRNHPLTHATGRVTIDSPIAPSVIALEELKTRCPNVLPPDAVHATLQIAQFEMGPCFRWFDRLWQGNGEALARLHRPEAVGSMAGYLLHPTLLDACLQLTVATTLPHGGGRATLVPFAIETCRFYQAAMDGQELWCHTRQVGEQRWDIQLLTSTGALLMEIGGIQFRPIAREAIAQNQTSGWLHQVIWRPQPHMADQVPLETPGNWLIFTDTSGLGEALATQLQARKQRCVLVSQADTYATTNTSGGLTAAPRVMLNPAVAEDFRRLLGDTLPSAQPACRGVVYLWGSETQSPTTDVPKVAYALSVAPLYLVQALDNAGLSPRLWFLTRGSQAVSETATVQVIQAPLWGFARSLARERPDLNCVCVDLAPNEGMTMEVEIAALLPELCAPDEERQVALRSTGRFVARLEPFSPNPRLMSNGSDVPIQVQLADFGTPDDLSLVPLTRRPPGDGEVEIEVKAAGLNFRDVLTVLGLLQDDYAAKLAAAELSLGSECAGTIVAVGSGVQHFSVGDDVIVANKGRFASYATVPEVCVVRKPAAMSFDEATTIPVAFLTAYYGLQELARMQPGDRILIHAAAGGVGQAACQLARAVGAEIFATASPQKWDFLRAQGIEHVMNSRTLDFADEIRRCTDGCGVDIVLNSLSGDFIAKSLSVLAPGGRFVEIGKRGIWQAQQVAAQRPDVAYYPFDLSQIGARDPTYVRSMLEGILCGFESGRFRPLRLTAFPVQQAVKAYRYMQQAKHIGKVVLTFGDRAVNLIRDDASYLITGGLGGLGLQMAHYLALQGARHLVLAGRSAITSPAAPEIRRQLEQLGASLTVLQADVSSADDVTRLLDTCGRLAALRGIIHAAGVLDDSAIHQQTAEHFARVMAPKIQGAWHLHTQTLDMPLDFFVCFSSLASLLGIAGQANYAAANAFLDALAHYRRALGLVSLSINWGPWAKVGMAADLESRHQVDWADLGLDPIAPQQGVALLDGLLQDSPPQIAVAHFNWPKFQQQFLHGSSPQFFQELCRDADHGPNATKPASPPTSQPQLLDQLRTGRPTERRALLTTYICEQIAQVLRNSPESIQPRLGLFDIGLDSLMAIELKQRLASGLRCVLPQTFLFDYPTVEAMVNILMQKLANEQEAQEANASEQRTDDTEQHRDATLDTQSPADLETLLAQAAHMTESDIARTFISGETER